MWDDYPSPDGTRLFYSNPAAHLVQDFLISNWIELPQLNTGPYPHSVSLSDYGNLAFATAESETMLFAFNATTGTLPTTFPLSGDPGIVRSLEDGTKAFVITSSGLEIVATGSSATTSPRSCSRSRARSRSLRANAEPGPMRRAAGSRNRRASRSGPNGPLFRLEPLVGSFSPMN